MPVSPHLIAFACTHCGSHEVSRDAWADWDVAAQTWVLRTAFDQAYCHHCEGETSLIEVRLRS